MRGSVYQRKDGRWVGVAELGKDGEGKRKQKYVYAASEKEAKIKLNNLVYGIQNNLYRKPQNITVLEYLKEWYELNPNKWEETTKATNNIYIEKHISKSMLASIKISDVLPMHLDAFYKSLLKPKDDKKALSVKTVKKIHYFLRSCFQYAKRNRLILINPADDIVLPESLKYEPVVYTESQFISLLDRVTGTIDEVVILLAGAAGLRRGEIFGLRWKDIDFNNSKIRIEETIVRINDYVVKSAKNQSSNRTIAVPEHLLSVLKRYKAKSNTTSFDGSDRVVSSYKAGAYSAHFKNLIASLGLPHIRLHDLRHYNAVAMMRYGVSDKVAASRLGHSQVQTLRKVYQHVLTDMDEDAAAQVGRMFDKKN